MAYMLRNLLITIMLAGALVTGPCAGRLYAAGPEGGVTFNLSNVEIANVAKFVSDVTGKNFMFDDRVTGKITIIAPTKISPEDAFTLFVSVLRLKGFALVPTGVDAYKIVPAAEAKQSGVDLIAAGSTIPMDDNTVARLISLQYISADDALKFLQPVVSKSGHISSFGPGNLLLVVDSGMVVDKVMKLVENIDLPAQSEEPDVVFLANAGAEAVAATLNDGLSRSAARRGGEQQPARAVADRRLNAVVLFGDRSAKEGMKRLISRLDVKADATQGAINVYFLENAAAEDIAKVLETIRKVSQDAASKQQPGLQAAQAAQPTRSPFESASGISITPDKASNSLIIIASPSDYSSLVQVIKKLDRRRRQVYVEAMVIEASMDKTRDLGTEWRAVALDDKRAPVVIGGVGTIDATAVSSIISGLSGMTVGGLGNFFSVPVTNTDGTIGSLTVPGYAALFSASIFSTAVNVLSTPQILTADNAEAEIIVGENVPFITQNNVNTVNSGVVSNYIERKDVGITLKLTPQITEGDYVKLDIYQEISALENISSNNLIAIITSVGPTTTKRSTKTNVVVRDGQTVVIGGLMQDKVTDTTSKVPLLGDIPLIGWLFKNNSKEHTKTNLLVFLTPHIIRDSKELEGLTGDKRMEISGEDDLYLDGELVVRFGPDVAAEKSAEILRSKGVTVVGTLADGRYIVRVLVPERTAETMRELKSTAGVVDVFRRLRTESLSAN